MTFKGTHPKTGATLWGCPLNVGNAKGSRWVIEWFDPNGWGNVEGQTDTTADQLLWILGNPLEVSEMRRKCEAWREKVDDIPF